MNHLKKRGMQGILSLLLLCSFILADNDTSIIPAFYVDNEDNFTILSSMFPPSAMPLLSSAMPTLAAFENITLTELDTTTIEVKTTRKTTPLPFKLPPRPAFVPHHHQGPRWGPYFEDGVESVNVTARVGTTVRLDCRIGMLHDKTVTWLHRKSDSIHLLTVGRHAYSTDQRITLSFRYPNNWRLEILYVTRRDEGLYECQVATHPPRVKQIYLKVTAPEVKIMDENRNEISERYYKAGSVVELSCLATQLERPADFITWMHGDVTVNKGITVNSSISDGAILSTIKLSHAQRGNSGNYTCAVGNLASTTVAVHILNGELPAAVHDGNSGSLGCSVWSWVLLTAALHTAICR